MLLPGHVKDTKGLYCWALISHVGCLVMDVDYVVMLKFRKTLIKTFDVNQTTNCLTLSLIFDLE